MEENMSNISKSYSSPVITRVVPHTQGYFWKRTHNVSQITLHHCRGTFAGSLRWLTTTPRPTRPTSAHFMVNLDEVVLMNGPSERACWSDGADSNLYTVSVEMANTIDAAPWPIAEKTLRKTAELCADLARFYKLGKLKLGGNVQLHKHMSSTECPGPTGTSRAQDIVNWANEINGYGKNTSTPNPAPTNGSFLVQVTASGLNVRQEPNTSSRINTSINDRGVYTIVEQRGSWGRLKSGAGWIHLDYTKRL